MKQGFYVDITHSICEHMNFRRTQTNKIDVHSQRHYVHGYIVHGYIVKREDDIWQILSARKNLFMSIEVAPACG